MFIYVITNKINGKQYIGQTTQTIKKRWKKHCSNINSKSHLCMPILYALRKYGKENFTIEKICECKTQEELDKMEIYYGKLFDTFSPNGYNLKLGNGPGAMSEETKKKISLSNKGKHVVSQETIKKLIQSHIGHEVKETTKKKLSKLNKDKKSSKLANKRCSEVTAKHYHVVSPLGKEVHIFNMRKWCKENGHQASNMCLLVNGKIKSYKGWTASKNLPEKNIPSRRSRRQLLRDRCKKVIY